MAKPRARVRAPRKPAAEFSRLVDVSRMGRLEHRMEIKANAEERAALAKRFDLVELPELTAGLALKKRGDGVFELTGRWHARLAQSCVVTLEPVWAELGDAVRLFFSDRPAASAAPFDPLAEDVETEPTENGVIDVGEAVVQLMGVALEPYPRAPGVPAP